MWWTLYSNQQLVWIPIYCIQYTSKSFPLHITGQRETTTKKFACASYWWSWYQDHHHHHQSIPIPLFQSNSVFKKKRNIRAKDFDCSWFIEISCTKCQTRTGATPEDKDWKKNNLEIKRLSRKEKQNDIDIDIGYSRLKPILRPCFLGWASISRLEIKCLQGLGTNARQTSFVPWHMVIVIQLNH